MGFTAVRSGMMLVLLIFLTGCAGHSAFTQAVIDRNDAFIDTYLAEGNNVDEPDGFGITALYQAVRQGDSFLAQKLLDAGADPNAVVGELGNRPLTAAARASQNNAQLTSLLLSAGADPNFSDIFGSSPLKIAAGEDLKDVARLLIDAGADVNDASSDATPLMIAVQNKYTDMVRLLLARGADVSIKRETPKKQYTALYYAVELRGWEPAEALYSKMVNRDAPGVPRTREFMEQQQQVIVDMLLSAGADPNGVSSDNEHTILTLAVSNPVEPALLETLLLAGADPNVPKGNGLYPLYISAGVEEDTTERTEMLLSYGANVDALNGQHQWTALFYSVHYNRLPAVKVLLAAGADASIGSAKGFTPLYQAAYKGHDEAFDYLLASGVDVNTLNGPNEFTPLLAAADRGQIDIARKLIAAGANVNKRSKQGYTPIYFSAKSDKKTKPIVEMLIAVGADVNARSNGYYPVHMAANKGYYEIVKILLDAGANPNLQDKDGDTALDLAMARGYQKTTAYLQQYGGRANNYKKDNSGELFGKIFATAAIGAIAAGADIPMENSLDVMSAAAKDIWVDDGKGNRLANMQKSMANGTYQIQDPSLRRLAETRLELEKQNREIQQQVQAYNAEQKRKQEAQRREMAQRQAEYRAQQQAYQQRQQEVAQARANEQRRLAEARKRAEQERRAQLAREAAERERLADEERERQVAERKRIAAERAAAAMRPKPQTGRIRQGRMNVADKADCDCKGTLTKRDLKIGSCDVASLTVAYEVTHFMGEPLVKGDYKWQAPAGGADDCLPAGMSLWLKIQNGDAFGYVEVDPAVPRAGKVSFSGTAGSPNWDSFICGYEGGSATQCFDREGARALYKQGRVTDFELSHR